MEAKRKERIKSFQRRMENLVSQLRPDDLFSSWEHELQLDPTVSGATNNISLTKRVMHDDTLQEQFEKLLRESLNDYFFATNQTRSSNPVAMGKGNGAVVMNKGNGAVMMNKGNRSVMMNNESGTIIRNNESGPIIHDRRGNVAVTNKRPFFARIPFPGLTKKGLVIGKVEPAPMDTMRIYSKTSPETVHIYSQVPVQMYSQAPVHIYSQVPAHLIEMKHGSRLYSLVQSVASSDETLFALSSQEVADKLLRFVETYLHDIATVQLVLNHFMLKFEAQPKTRLAICRLQFFLFIHMGDHLSAYNMLPMFPRLFLPQELIELVHFHLGNNKLLETTSPPPSLFSIYHYYLLALFHYERQEWLPCKQALDIATSNQYHSYQQDNHKWNTYQQGNRQSNSHQQDNRQWNTYQQGNHQWSAMEPNHTCCIVVLSAWMWNMGFLDFERAEKIFLCGLEALSSHPLELVTVQFEYAKFLWQFKGRRAESISHFHNLLTRSIHAKAKHLTFYLHALSLFSTPRLSRTLDNWSSRIIDAVLARSCNLSLVTLQNDSGAYSGANSGYRVVDIQPHTGHRVNEHHVTGTVMMQLEHPFEASFLYAACARYWYLHHSFPRAERALDCYLRAHALEWHSSVTVVMGGHYSEYCHSVNQEQVLLRLYRTRDDDSSHILCANDLLSVTSELVQFLQHLIESRVLVEQVRQIASFLVDRIRLALLAKQSVPALAPQNTQPVLAEREKNTLVPKLSVPALTEGDKKNNVFVPSFSPVMTLRLETILNAVLQLTVGRETLVSL